ncbi:hypothetical protein RCZ04_11820 [Capnocytophaga sp. HP1101]
MKRILLLAISLLVGGVATAQEDLQAQIDQLGAELGRLKEADASALQMQAQQMGVENPVDKKFNMYFNFQSSFDVEKVKDQDMTAQFKARQLRLEVRGDITDRIFYRFRHRLNKSNAATSLDNLAKATDMLYAGFRLNDQWALTAGKMCQAWGGYEFDLNPMNIYEYSDFIENMDNFMLGAMITYAPNENHEFNLQITDVRNDSFATLYAGSGFEASKSPLTYIFNWNGSFFDNKLQTRWGAGIQQEAKNIANSMVMLGTKLNLPKFQLFFDYMMAYENLDRLGYAAVYTTTAVTVPAYLEDTSYNSFVVKAEFQPIPQLNIFAKGMYEMADVENSSLPSGCYDNNYRSLGYFAGVEYMPFEKQDLRFFLAYVGRSYKYDQQVAGIKDDTNRVSVGLMYRIKAF